MKLLVQQVTIYHIYEDIVIYNIWRQNG